MAPISRLASRYPEVLAILEADLADTEGGSLHGKFVLRPFGALSNPQAVELNPVSYTHLRDHENVLNLVCRLLLGKKKNDVTQI